MQEPSSTDPPACEQVELVPETIEDVKDEGPSFHCDLCDAELVHKIAEILLPGLATACVDNSTGGLFSSPGSVAADIRKEMVDIMTIRSEHFVAESVIVEGSPGAEQSDHPFDIISDFIDDFASSKRNFFSRVSGWLLSEKREDNVDDFVQEMEINGFWLLDKREAFAQTLLRNVDFKNVFHCDKKFHSPEELSEHLPQCSFRSMNCENEGCIAIFSLNQLEMHDLVCPFKVIPCEQKCSSNIMRREMDRHCITVCPMKLVNCPFYAVGCQSAVPSCFMEKHRSEELHSHLLFVLQVIHKDASVEDLKRRIEELEKASTGNLADARDPRTLTSRVKNLEAKLGPLQITPPKTVEEVAKTTDKDVEEKLESREVTAKSKDSEDAKETATKDSVAKLETVSAKDIEAKLEPPEAGIKKENNGKSEETAVKDSEAKRDSADANTRNKDSEEAGVKHSEAAREGNNKDKDSEAGETAVKDSEAKPRSSGVSPTTQAGEKATEDQLNDTTTEKAVQSELSMSNKSSDQDSETTKHVTQVAEN